MTASATTATATMKLGRCLYGAGTFHGGCGRECHRFKKVRGKKDICTCGHGAEWHEVGGVAVVLTETDVRAAFEAARAAIVFEVEERLRKLEATVLRGLPRPKPTPNGIVTVTHIRGGERIGSDHAVTLPEGPPRVLEADSPPKAARALAAVLFHGPLSKDDLLVRAVYSGKTKNVQNALSWLRTRGWVETDHGCLRLTDLGVRSTSSVGAFLVAERGHELREAWLRNKLGRAERAIVSALAAAPDALSRGELADACAHHGGPPEGYSLATKNFQNALSRLRGLGLLRGPRDALEIHPDLKDSS